MYIHRTFWENNVLQETFYLWYLVSDLNSGRYINQPGRKCNRLCVGRECCDALATCKCGTHTGKYECLCPAGHYGNGLKGSCQGEFNCHQHTHRNNIEQSTYKQYLYKICSGMNANTFAKLKHHFDTHQLSLLFRFYLAFFTFLSLLACPSGTYKSDDNPGDVRTCVKCPDENHVTEPGATSGEQCVCRKGYRNFNNNGCAGME